MVSYCLTASRDSLPGADHRWWDSPVTFACCHLPPTLPPASIAIGPHLYSHSHVEMGEVFAWSSSGVCYDRIMKLHSPWTYLPPEKLRTWSLEVGLATLPTHKFARQPFYYYVLLEINITVQSLALLEHQGSVFDSRCGHALTYGFRRIHVPPHGAIIFGYDVSGEIVAQSYRKPNILVPKLTKRNLFHGFFVKTRSFKV